jgi:uncharacterized membrane protein HdeD (DUF308 family)
MINNLQKSGGLSAILEAVIYIVAFIIVTEGLGGGNEVVGGVWVILLSFAALKERSFPKPLIFLGIIVGLVGILTIYPADLFTDFFVISQIIWFIWLGIFMLRNAPKSVH